MANSTVIGAGTTLLYCAFSLGHVTASLLRDTRLHVSTVLVTTVNTEVTNKKHTKRATKQTTGRTSRTRWELAVGQDTHFSLPAHVHK